MKPGSTPKPHGWPIHDTGGFMRRRTERPALTLQGPPSVGGDLKYSKSGSSKSRACPARLNPRDMIARSFIHRLGESTNDRRICQYHYAIGTTEGGHRVEHSGAAEVDGIAPPVTTAAASTESVTRSTAATRRHRRSIGQKKRWAAKKAAEAAHVAIPANAARPKSRLYAGGPANALPKR